MDEDTPDTDVDFVAEVVSYSQPMVSGDYIIMMSGD